MDSQQKLYQSKTAGETFPKNDPTVSNGNCLSNAASLDCRKALLDRDKCCIATGERDRHMVLVARLVPLNSVYRISHERFYSPQNAIALRKDLKQSYDMFELIFEADGRVVVLNDYWINKNRITQLSLSSDLATRPCSALIEIHNQLARSMQPHFCPRCWKLVGNSNLESHKMESCSAIWPGDENTDSDEE